MVVVFCSLVHLHQYSFPSTCVQNMVRIRYSVLLTIKLRTSSSNPARFSCNPNKHCSLMHRSTCKCTEVMNQVLTKRLRIMQSLIHALNIELVKSNNAIHFKNMQLMSSNLCNSIPRILLSVAYKNTHGVTILQILRIRDNCSNK